MSEKKPKAGCWRPETHEEKFAELREAYNAAPEGWAASPKHIVLISWLSLKGDNSQRGGGRWANNDWKITMRNDFLWCLEQRQNFSGMIKRPKLFARIYLGSKGDDTAVFGRMKYPQDLLQVPTMQHMKNGKTRQQGLLGIIQTDATLLRSDYVGIQEIAVRKKDEFGLRRHKLEYFIWEDNNVAL
jgi:hypothetical protein